MTIATDNTAQRGVHWSDPTQKVLWSLWAISSSATYRALGLEQITYNIEEYNMSVETTAGSRQQVENLMTDMANIRGTGRMKRAFHIMEQYAKLLTKFRKDHDFHESEATERALSYAIIRFEMLVERLAQVPTGNEGYRHAE